MRPTHVIFAPLIAGLLAAPAHAERLTLLDFLSIDRLANIGATWALTSLRSLAKVTYVDLDVQPLQGRMALTGVDVRPYGSPSSADCVMTFDRVVLASAPLDQVTNAALDIDILGANIAQACLDRETAVMLLEFGIDDIEVDRAEMNLEYTFNTGGLEIDLSARASALADIRANVLFDYVSIDAETEEPIVDLVSAEVEIIDHGLTNVLSPVLPMEAQDEETLAQLLSAMLLPPAPPGASPADPGSSSASPGAGAGETVPKIIERLPRLDPKTAAASIWIDDTARTLAQFVNTPGQLHLRIAPEAPVRLEGEIAEDFVDFVQVFRPKISAGVSSETPRTTASDLVALRSWLAGRQSQLTDGDAVRHARAFLSGIGAPRDRALGAEILSKLLENGSAEAVALALDYLSALEPTTGYRIVWQAAAKGDRAAFAHLDGLEKDLPLADIIAVQDQARTPRDGLATRGPRTLLDHGFTALTGLGAPRNYGDAYLFGLLAAAGGEKSGAALVDEVEAIGDRLDGDEAGAWRTYLAKIRTEASNLWFSQAPD